MNEYSEGIDTLNQICHSLGREASEINIDLLYRLIERSQTLLRKTLKECVRVERLPRDTVILIFCYLPLEDFKTVFMVCQEWRFVANMKELKKCYCEAMLPFLRDKSKFSLENLDYESFFKEKFQSKKFIDCFKTAVHSNQGEYSQFGSYQLEYISKYIPVLSEFITEIPSKKITSQKELFLSMINIYSLSFDIRDCEARCSCDDHGTEFDLWINFKIYTNNQKEPFFHISISKQGSYDNVTSSNCEFQRKVPNKKNKRCWWMDWMSQLLCQPDAFQQSFQQNTYSKLINGLEFFAKIYKTIQCDGLSISDFFECMNLIGVIGKIHNDNLEKISTLKIFK